MFRREDESDNGVADFGNVVVAETNNTRVFAARLPDGRRRGAEQRDGGRADGGSQMRDAGVVADEQGAAFEDGGEFNQLQSVDPVERTRCDQFREARDGCVVGFAVDEEELDGEFVHEPAGDGGEVLGGPVLAFAAAAGMERDNPFAARHRKVTRGQRAVVVVEVDTRRGLFDVDGERLERFAVVLGGRQHGRARRRFDDLPDAAAADVVGEDVVGVEDVGDDKVEAVEVGGERFVERAVRDEEASHRSGFDGTDSVGVVSLAGEFDDVGITENLDVGIRPAFAQRADGRQCQDEVADGAAAHDEDTGSIHQCL